LNNRPRQAAYNAQHLKISRAPPLTKRCKPLKYKLRASSIGRLAVPWMEGRDLL
jgi:hypothetical protein